MAESPYKINFDAQGRPYETSSGKKRFLTPTEAGSWARLFIRDPAQQAEAIQADMDSGVMTPEDRQRLLAYTAAYQVTPDNPSGNTPTKNGYATKVKFNPATGEWDHSMGAGLAGTLQGAAAVAAPMVIGPAIASMLAPAAAVPGATAGTTAAGSTGAAFSPTGVASVVPGTASTAAGSAASGAAPIAFSTPAGVSSAALSGSVAPAAGAGAGGTVAASGTGAASQGIWAKHGGDILDTVGTGISDATEAAANNRSTKLSAQAELERLMLLREQQLQKQQIDREKEGRAGASDAYRKMVSAQHLLSPGAAPQNAGPYNVAPRVATDTERAGATALSDEVMKRLTGGNPIPAVTQHPLEYDKSLMNPSGLEKAGNWLGPAAKVAKWFF